jgi:hypothetical protein
MTINALELNIISKTKKSMQESFEFKSMLIVFFDIQSIVMPDWVLSGQTVNRQYYIEIFMKLCERMRRKWPELWKNAWILHQDNVPAHNSLSVKQFLANKNITVLDHPPYSPDLAPRDFYPILKIKSMLQRAPFWVSRKCKSKNSGSPQQPYRTWTAELLWTLAASFAAECQLRRELFGRRSQLISWIC